jgi:hypothetical protein
MTTLHTATVSDAEKIGGMLREIDRHECRLSGMPEETAPLLSLSASACAWTAKDGGAPICMFGVVPVEPGLGSLWLLATPDFDEHSRDLLRLAPSQVALMHSLFPTLVVQLAPENDKSIRFLRWLGFRKPAEPVVEVPAPLIQMVKTADV